MEPPRNRLPGRATVRARMLTRRGPVATYLDRIVAAHRAVAAADARDIVSLVAAAAVPGHQRDFTGALRDSPRLNVVAEIKRRSPSKGPLNLDLEAATLAAAYAAGGAACLSVLTDSDFFGGSSDDLVAARAAVGLPVLRKDFTVSPADVADARLMGADCVLLIVAALSQIELDEFRALAEDRLGMAALVEVHDEKELESALEAGAHLVGVNQRDLVTFEVDHARAERMAGVIPDDVVKVAESGIRGVEDAKRLAAAGYHALLVGEHLVTSGDPGAAVRALASVTR